MPASKHFNERWVSYNRTKKRGLLNPKPRILDLPVNENNHEEKGTDDIKTIKRQALSPHIKETSHDNSNCGGRRINSLSSGLARLGAN